MRQFKVGDKVVITNFDDQSSLTQRNCGHKLGDVVTIIEDGGNTIRADSGFHLYKSWCVVKGNSISIVWDIEDVLQQDDSLTDDEARDVLQRMESNHDATVGINWDVIDHYIAEVLSNAKP